MNQASTIEIPVEAATATALADARRREAVGRLVDRLVRPGVDDPLIALFARGAGLTEAEIEAELAGLQCGAPGLSVYVFDANTVVSAGLNPDGPPRRAIATATDQRHHSFVGGRAWGSRGGSGEAEIRAGAHR